MSERIQKLLATVGVASRRAIEEMIAEGRVTVNGRPAEIGQRIDHNDHVRVDGRSIALARKADTTRVLLYRKKVGEVVTRDDPEGRRTVFRKLPELEGSRWIAVGRLDINTSGLLLLTNNGELARRLMHPSFEISREYAVRVLGDVTDEVIERLKRGVRLEDGPAKFDSIRSSQNQDDDDDGANTWWNVTLTEGRNREVRRLFESQNLQVSRLMRVAYGPVQLGRGIKAGTAREATPEELLALLEAVGMAADTAPAAAKAAARKPAHKRTAGRGKPQEEPHKPAEAPRKRSFQRRDDDDGAPRRKSAPGKHPVGRRDAEPSRTPARDAERRAASRSDREADRPHRPERAGRDAATPAPRDAAKRPRTDSRREAEPSRRPARDAVRDQAAGQRGSPRDAAKSGRGDRGASSGKPARDPAARKPGFKGKPPTRRKP